MAEKELGERNFGFESTLKRYMEEKGIVAVCGTAVSSLPTCRPLGRMRTPPAGLLLLLRRQRSLHTSVRTMDHWRNYMNLQLSTENIFLKC